ncbi:hypothetical protein AB0F03_31225 [Streptomyces sp. NPDC028722]|uniref:hypothetical protein n=1 Tax=unclassified Streptomyces TaxID=2593676 RepID=UPI0033D77B21
MRIVGKILIGLLGVVVLAGVGLWFAVHHIVSDVAAHMITKAQFETIHVGEKREAVRDHLGKPKSLAPPEGLEPPAGTTCDHYLERKVPLEKKRTFRICYREGKVVVTQILPPAEQEGTPDDGRNSGGAKP